MMDLIDVLLNATGLLLWLSWRSGGFAQAADPVSLLATLKRAEARSNRAWLWLALVIMLLGCRSIFYWRMGSALNWTPTLNLGSISLPFRSDEPARILLFSALSFGQWLAVFYLWLLLLSVVNRKESSSDAFQRMIGLHLGWVRYWPAALRLALPLVVVCALWWLIHPLLVYLGLVPGGAPVSRLWQQGAILGLGTYLAWEGLIVSILFLHLLNNYVYLGNIAFWNFVNGTARRFLYPVRWVPLPSGRIDFTPLLGMIVVVVLAEFSNRGLTMLYRKVL